MATLESQYKSYLIKNNSNITFEEWYETIYIPKILSFKEQEQDIIKDWDNTLLDGLDDLPWDENINNNDD